MSERRRSNCRSSVARFSARAPYSSGRFTENSRLGIEGIATGWWQIAVLRRR